MSTHQLEERIASGELRESRVLEFKRQAPENSKLARHIAGLAAEGGVLVIGVAETEAGLTVTPIDCKGARERVEQVARDVPYPPVHLSSHILEGETPGLGVLWIEIPASPEMLHQVEGTYYARDDTQTRPMRDPEVSDRMALRKERPGRIGQALEDALKREQPTAPSLHARTCVVAQPIGAPGDEFYKRTRNRDVWESCAFDLQQPKGFLLAVPDRYWGKISQNVVSRGYDFQPPISVSLPSYRDIEFWENGSFCHLSYSQDWIRGNGTGIFPFSALRACEEAISLIAAVQSRTGQRRAWDLAFSISDVGGRTARTRTSYFTPLENDAQSEYQPLSEYDRPLPIPRAEYVGSVLGVRTDVLESDSQGVVQKLAGRFVAECGLDLDEEWAGELGLR